MPSIVLTEEQLQKIVDGLFMQVERKAVGHPIAVAVLDATKEVLDQAIPIAIADINALLNQ